MANEIAEDYEYDLVTIGAGSGGVRASRVCASKYGKKVAIVELPFGFVPSEEIGGAGGTCVIRGCVPKKLLVYASEFSEGYRAAEGFGWAEARPPVDIKKLIARKNKEIERLNSVYGTILKNAGVEQLEGRGVVLDPHTVEVRAADGSVRRLKTKNILVATGAYAVKLSIPGAEYAMTSDDALVLDDYPDKPIVVLGAGYIAVEFAGIFAGLGADVHLMYRAPLPLRHFDGECRAMVAENMARRGISLHPECHPQRIEKLGDGSFLLHYTDASGASQTIACGKVMMATGRHPHTRGLGLEDAGVELDPKTNAIRVDTYGQTRVPSIWSIGDATDRMCLTPVAIAEGKALAATLFGGGDPVAPDYEAVPTAVFCQPPLAAVGPHETEAAELFAGELDVYVSRFRPMRNTLSGSEERTLMKLLVHVGSDKVVGAHMVGPEAGEIMQGLAIAIKCGATKTQFDATIGIHPSSAEEWVTMSGPTRRIKCTGTEEP